MDHTRRPSAGTVLAVVSVVPALALAGWLLAGLPLLLLGWFRPAAAIPLGLLVAALLCRYGLRRLPKTVEATAWQTTAVIAVALASGVFNGLFHSEQLIIRRDPSTYAQYALWLAGHGSLPIPFQEAAFGGANPALHFDSMGLYDFGGAIVPQFMPGSPMIDAVGAWLGGLSGLFLVPPLMGALAVLVVAGVVARLVGARWAPPAALVFAVSLPILYTSRTTFSEIPSLIMLFGGLALLFDAEARLRPGLAGAGHPQAVPSGAEPAAPSGGDLAVASGAEPGGIRPAGSGGAVIGAVLAGLVFGLAVLVRIDGLRDVLPAVVYAGLLIALRRVGARDEGRLGVPLLCGLAAGVAGGFAAAYLLSRPYLDYLSGSLNPLLAICGAVLALTLIAALLAPRLAVVVRWAAGIRRLPEIAGGLVVLIMVAFAVRPWLQTVTRWPTTGDDRVNFEFIERTQQANGLPMDGSRLYYEESLHWVIWYVGIPTVVLATLAAAVLTRRLVRGGEFAWLLPLAVIGWTTFTTLYRPAITPDQPWASRRLVPIVIPGLILLAVWGLRWARDKARRSGYGPTVQKNVAAFGVALLLIPTALTSAGTAFNQIERGERAAVEGMCAALPARASVLIVERVTGDRLTQVVRGTCGVPTARVALLRDAGVSVRPTVTYVADRVRAAGRVPVLLAAEARQLSAYGTPVQIMGLRTRQDERSLVDPPDGTWSLAVNVWMIVL
ncbi:hypothetical protein [Streptosporangium lutulentum]|uniref:Glycosyltransferase RgtA/B/C/D-like domain-containing protein n=1 Tax=Streptosporangium lutulentum TaxID=1461250 RepID=A0ABT9QJF2_9ACTN|nr:hypothetical protein [Streptosporangium lutulentum]MDP9846485.1 hypothetical protein [Streptosporangium lutulentum]